MSLTSSQARTLTWVAVAVVLWWGIDLLAPVLLPFLAALAMAYVLRPLVDALQARRVPRWLAAGGVVALLFLLLAAAVLMVLPVLTRLLPALRDQIPAWLEHLNLALAPFAQRWGLPVEIDVNWVRDGLQRLVAGHEGMLLERVLASLRIGGSALLAVLGNLVLMPIVAYYLLLDWDALMPRLRALVPPRWREATQHFLSDTDDVLRQYLRGQLLVMAVLAVFYALALSVVGLDLALPIGVFTGLAVFVPYVGFGLGLLLGLLAALLEFQSAWGVGLVAAVYTVGQLLESFYLTPRLVGERIGLHPLAVIFALMAFGHVLGFLGVLIALPCSAVLLVTLHRVQTFYLGSSLYTHAAPVTPDPAQPEDTAP
ncbi:MAG TPA: AI-2E family transporter [Macromonas sp.]|nr:AI-2E family transporter [Macromonas sp.]